MSTSSQPEQFRSPQHAAEEPAICFEELQKKIEDDLQQAEFVQSIKRFRRMMQQRRKEAASRRQHILKQLSQHAQQRKMPKLARASPRSSASAIDVHQSVLVSCTEADCDVKERPTKRRKRKNATFNESLTVVMIPEIADYSPQTRANLWEDHEIQAKTILRNKLEFAHEGFEWRSAFEENEMQYDQNADYHIHPVHARRRRMLAYAST
jgi:hypothetical protein